MLRLCGVADRRMSIRGLVANACPRIGLGNHSPIDVYGNSGSLLSSFARRHESSGGGNPNRFSFKDMLAESHLSGNNVNYSEEVFEDWAEDPNTVPQSFNDEFHGVRKAGAPIINTVTTTRDRVFQRDIMDQLNLTNVIRAYQIRGHKLADLDPLDMRRPDIPPELQVTSSDFSQHPFKVPNNCFIAPENSFLMPEQIVQRLRAAYSNKIGADFMHIPDLALCNWLRERIETPGVINFSHDEKRLILRRLLDATKFEEFLSKKWPSEKRFGLEGLEMMIPCVKTIIDKCSEMGCEVFIIGMAHRGRLNTLANVAKIPLKRIFSQFNPQVSEAEGSGDVKYHLGTLVKRYNFGTKKEVKIVIVANPSHLEAVNPVVLGKVRGEQEIRKDYDGKKVMGILIHGDAAYAGQGIVYETHHQTDLPGYNTFGTIHIVANNQIGFTTAPRVARSSEFCTDVAKVSDSPIMHVNADSPEDVIYVSKMAAEWRMTMQKDFVIDIIGYRKYGHNEMDEPGFTQPLMCQRIKQTPNSLSKYAQKLLDEGLVTNEYFKRNIDSYWKLCEDEFTAAKDAPISKKHHWMGSVWDRSYYSKENVSCGPTGCSLDTIKFIGGKVSTIDDAIFPQFTLHKGIHRILQQRAEFTENGVLDWSLAEKMAFGSLLMDGVRVRLSGQDVERGTFSQRHDILHDQLVDRRTVCLLNHLTADQSPYTVINSPLQEFGVLGFELGHSTVDPHFLTIWEAQFGDFCNTAQCIIDQFICAGESKWFRQTGIVMLLPHGYEGMGPEHSSARPERFLQMTNEDEDVFPAFEGDFEVTQLSRCNWILANCSTPANYFHILRRQMKLSFRKPLVLFTPKSLLRLPACKSTFEELGPGTKFLRVISDSGAVTSAPEAVTRIIFCTGRVYYDLIAERELRDLNSKVAVVRLEQLAPFPFDLMEDEMKRFPNAELIWCQEEHKNMGYWAFIRPRVETVMRHIKDSRSQTYSSDIRFIGRNPSASTAVGSKGAHDIEKNKFLDDAFRL